MQGPKCRDPHRMTERATLAGPVEIESRRDIERLARERRGPLKDLSALASKEAMLQVDKNKTLRKTGDQVGVVPSIHAFDFRQSVSSFAP